MGLPSFTKINSRFTLTINTEIQSIISMCNHFITFILTILEDLIVTVRKK